MNIKVFRSFLSLFFLFLAQTLCAQSESLQKIEMADVLHQNGKIYLVVLVLLTIFAGILFLLIRIELRLRRLEKEKEKK